MCSTVAKEKCLQSARWPKLQHASACAAVCAGCRLLAQNLDPATALATLATSGLYDHHYHHFPLLVLFGGMSIESAVHHNTTAFEAAAVIAKQALER